MTSAPLFRPGSPLEILNLDEDSGPPPAALKVIQITPQTSENNQQSSARSKPFFDDIDSDDEVEIEEVVVQPKPSSPIYAGKSSPIRLESVPEHGTPPTKRQKVKHTELVDHLEAEKLPDDGLWTAKYIGESPIKGYTLYRSSLGRLRSGEKVLLRAQETSDGTIVRFQNTKKQTIGRINGKASKYLYTLIKQELITTKGSCIDILTDNRGNFQSGASVTLLIQFLLTRKAFDASLIFPDARDLAFRKEALRWLFDRISLQPTIPTKTNRTSSKEFFEASKQEIETEVEGEDPIMNNKQLALIYSKSMAKNEIRLLSEKDPSEGFALTLRPYQKQALFWMSRLEEKTESTERDNTKAQVKSTDEASQEMDDSWAEYSFPSDPSHASCSEDLGVLTLTLDDTDDFYFNPSEGRLSLTMPKGETWSSGVGKGGILADEMGLGKTIMISSLIYSMLPYPIEQTDGVGSSPVDTLKPTQLKIPKASKLCKGTPKATLIVAPMTLIAQWCSEIRRSSRNECRVIMYYGSSRSGKTLVDEIDEMATVYRHTVVVTSYGTLAAEYRASGITGDADNDIHDQSIKNKSSHVGIYTVDWFRAVLDEAHTIKARKSLNAQACFAIRALRKWCITGTPIINRLDDLYSLFRFIQLKPWGDYSIFKSFITTPFEAQDSQALEIVQIILESSLLRRDKAMKGLDGKPIVTLPPKHIKTLPLEFSAAERAIYDALYRNAKDKFMAFNEQGTVMKNTIAIFAILMRVRQAVLHPALVIDKIKQNLGKLTGQELKDEREVLDLVLRFEHSGRREDSLIPQSVAKIEQACCICEDITESSVAFPGCNHAGCRECLDIYITDLQTRSLPIHCPVCNAGPFEGDVILNNRTSPSLVKQSMDREKEVKQPEILILDDSDVEQPQLKAVLPFGSKFISSTKLDALIFSLNRMKTQDSTAKAVVFSQFTGFLDLIERSLTQNHFVFYRLDGTMSQPAREKAVSSFTKTPKCAIFVASLKAAGVGLNLVAASHVYLMDTWWNAAIENQAIDRIHRLGQTKEVQVTRFIVTDSIEEKMIAIQDRKTRIADGALGGNKDEREQIENFKLIFDN